MIGELADKLEHLDMEGFLEWYGIDYKRKFGKSGTQLNVKTCPRCGGTSWKVFINAETGLGNCFHGACAGEGGFNKFSFIRHLVDGRAEAHNTIERYLRQTGWRPRPKAVPVELPMAFVDEPQLPASVALPFEADYVVAVPGERSVTVPAGDVLPYLSRRGFTAEDAAYFGWRYCERGEYVVPGRDYSQDYSHRILLPVCDLEGHLVTFQGRDITGTHEKKYLFPPGLAGSARYLYNGHNCLDCEEIVVCEGVFDVAAVRKAFQSDITMRDIGIVGSFGKELTMSGGDDQLGAMMALKARGLRTVTFMWDGEQKTVIQAIKSALALHRHGFETLVAVLPLDKDPNEVPASVVIEAYLGAHPITTGSAARLITLATMSRLKPRSIAL